MSKIDSSKLSTWYDFQAPIYHFWRDNYANPLITRVVELLDSRKPQRVLDVGCGSGLMSVGLSILRPDWELEGVDCSRGLLRIAQKQAKKHSLCKLKFSHGDVLSLKFAEQDFESVVAAGLFPNLNEPNGALREVFRVLKSGGRFVVVEFDRTTMCFSTRCFFRVMISGYRLFSALFPRFRFAEKWDIDSSTIDELKFLNALQTTGFLVENLLREHQHLIFVCRKP